MSTAQETKIAQSAMPLVDEYVRGCWTEDLDPGDVRDILMRAKLEAEKGVGEIESALDRNDLVTLRKSAHKLKGMMGNLGAARLAHALRQIEVGAAEQHDISLPCSALRPLLRDSLEAFDIG